MWNARAEAPVSRPAAQVPVTQVPVTPQERLPEVGIGPSVVIRGEISSAEDLIINGRVEGTIEIGDHHLTVGAGGSVTAPLTARAITISGAVRGNVTARERIEVRATGSVHGDLRAPHIVVCEGAALKGRVTTQPAHAEIERRLPVAV
jgi:cytoskeletal protein CcmA (bactofilin family)